MVLAGDFNAYRQYWDPRCTKQRDARFWDQIIDEHGLVIGNQDGATHYWTRHDSMGESILDLTQAHRPFGKSIILDRSYATGSDPEII